MFRTLKILASGFILLFVLLLQISWSQVPVTKSENKVIIEGKVYYLHIVKPGQTLYSITRAYGVEEKDIAIENPGVYSGLQVGQVLKIPAEVPGKDYEPEIDTTKYKVHILEEDETLFSLSRRYNVTVEEIKSANPGLDETDLAIGEEILIPKLKTVREDENFELHRVRKKETIYSLSRRYGVTEEDIRKFNPVLQWGELKAGQVIRIPKPAMLQDYFHEYFEDMTINDSIESPQKEDLSYDNYIDSLGLEELTLNDYARQFRDFSRRKLKVAVLIPFNYRIDPRDTMQIDEEEDELSDEEKEKLEMEKNLPRSINFLEFFEGSLLALDSLKKEGYSVDIRYFDTYRTPSKVREILEDPFFRDVDLIIGPFFNYNVEIVSEFSRLNRVPLISPFYDGLDLTNQNPYLFQVNPSYKTEYSMAAKLLSIDYYKNFIFIYRKDSSKYHEIDFFKSSLIENLRDYIHTENVVIKEITYENAAKANLADDLSHALSKNKENIVIIPERNEAFVHTVITQLYFQLKEFDINVFGLPYFHEFKNIDFQYYHALKLRYLSPFYYDYEDDQVLSFLNLFYENFNSEPILATRKGCPYAFVGFDITYFFIKQILDENRRFITRLEENNIDNLLPDFEFSRNNSYGGFENKSLYLVNFTKDYGVLSQDADNIEIPRKSDWPRLFHLEWDRDEIK